MCLTDLLTLPEHLRYQDTLVWLVGVILDGHENLSIATVVKTPLSTGEMKRQFFSCHRWARRNKVASWKSLPFCVAATVLSSKWRRMSNPPDRREAYARSMRLIVDKFTPKKEEKPKPEPEQLKSSCREEEARAYWERIKYTEIQERT